MIVPSIDLRGGNAVQLVGGREQKLDAGDPRPIAERFAAAGEIAVVDLDAALGTGSNASVVGDLVTRFPCRVGGGIRTYESAVRWLDAGAAKIVLGTAADPDLLARLPRDRVIAALDARHGEVAVEGWTKPTGRTVLERIRELRPYVGGFLVTFIEREGRLGGIDLEEVRPLVEAADGVRVTAAGGVTTVDEVAALDAMGVDAQVGMALYTGRMELADALLAPLLVRDPEALWPTVVCDERGAALGLAWSDRESVREALRTRRGVYRSRRRGLWVKGETSGNGQDLLRIDLDCDRDALRFTVRQRGPGFCHAGTRTCWGGERGLDRLTRTLAARRADGPPGSYSRRLFSEPGLLPSKLIEEAYELARAETHEDIVHEAADVLYFTLATLVANGVPLDEVESELDRRALRVRRRAGDAKYPTEARS